MPAENMAQHCRGLKQCLPARSTGVVRVLWGPCVPLPPRHATARIAGGDWRRIAPPDAMQIEQSKRNIVGPSSCMSPRFGLRLGLRRDYNTGMKTSRKSGQSLIESCLVILLICLIFAGVMQVSQIAAGREILHHAAARGARAKTVGFNYWMVKKAVRVAAIPNAGPMTTPAFENTDTGLRLALETRRPGDLWDAVLGGELQPSSAQYHIEAARIPEYLGSLHEWRARHILDYEDWDSVHFSTPLLLFGTAGFQPELEVGTSQDYPLWVPGHRAFYAADEVGLSGRCLMEAHYPLYIEDRAW
ncbi:MAG: hypothetical protein R6V03_00605 [Kiritimatiellia bacterium]